MSCPPSDVARGNAHGRKQHAEPVFPGMRADLHPHGVGPAGSVKPSYSRSGKIHILQPNRYRVAVSAGTHRALGHSADGPPDPPPAARSAPSFGILFGSEHAAPPPEGSHPAPPASVPGPPLNRSANICRRSVSSRTPAHAAENRESCSGSAPAPAPAGRKAPHRPPGAPCGQGVRPAPRAVSAFLSNLIGIHTPLWPKCGQTLRQLFPAFPQNKDFTFYGGFALRA